MLYIDQPNQVGFSWDILTNGTKDQTESEDDNLAPVDPTAPLPALNSTFSTGTFPSQQPANSANSTVNAARALWHFAQVWFQEFPDYKPNNDKISIFTESYGGKYGPATASFFEEQNERIANRSINDQGETYVIHLDTLGIINGCVDLLTQEFSYLTMAYNNTYGIQAIDQSLYQEGVDAYNEPDSGCRDLILKCRSLAAEGDPYFIGLNQTVNDACMDAVNFCNAKIEGIYIENSDRNYYDIAAIDPDPFPPQYFLGYFTNQYVQVALGVPVNFTESTNGVAAGFESTGDYARGGFLEDLGYLLEKGVKVALIYGDRDYACNWYGGEEVSLAVNYSQADAFRLAGYANISVNSSYVGGQVRQHGNLSFSRVYQAGHEIPAYQPETAYEIFMRAILGKDIATGTLDTAHNASYSTVGSNTTVQIRNEDLRSPSPQCYVLSLGTTCTEEQQEIVENGTGLIHNYILIDANQSHLFPGVGNNDSAGGPPATKAGKADVLRVSWMVMVVALVFVGSVAAVW